MVFQYATRYRWLLWLSGALVLSSLASTKAASSFRHALGASSEDQLNRQLSVDTPPVLGFKSINEERALPLSPEVLASYDELVGTSSNYKGWMEKLGLSIGKEKVLDQKTFDTVFPVLLNKQDFLELRQLFHDPNVYFWKVKVGGMSLGLRLLQQWKKERVSDLNIMKRMLLTDSNGRNMLTDGPMLRTWISFSGGQNLQRTEYYKLLAKLPDTLALKDVLRFYFVVGTKSQNLNLKDAASLHTFQMFEDFYKAELDRGKIVDGLMITDGETLKMKSVLDTYDNFCLLRSFDRKEIAKIAKAESGYEAREAFLVTKWLKEKWFPNNVWRLSKEEEEVFERLRSTLLNHLEINL